MNGSFEKQMMYVITEGEYSDYSIVAVFSTKQLAQKFIDAHKASRWSSPRIEEYELDPRQGALNLNHKPFAVRMERCGDVVECEHSEVLNTTERDSEPSFDREGNLHDVVWAKNGDHAVKIVSERRRQLIANNEWKGSNNEP
jgi:hypothetical protein